MEMDFENKFCPIIDVDGHIASGKQYDLDITLPKDDRNVVYGVIKDYHKEPIKDAIVKLIEVNFKKKKEKRKPVSHTFTDEDGEFVFGPLCPDKEYAIDFWANAVRHYKMCAKIEKDTDCLKGKPAQICGCKPDHKPDCKPEMKPEPRNA